MTTVVSKQSGEKLIYAFEFADKIGDTGVTISTINTLTATKLGLVDGSAGVTISGQVIVGQNVQAFIEGGTSGEAYLLRCRITDSEDQQHEGDGTLRVLDIPQASAIVIEDGSVVAGANSYASAVQASEYLRARNRATAWDALEPTAQEAYLIQATAFMGQRYRSAWKGVRRSAAQSLDWPRAYVDYEPVYQSTGIVADPVTGGFWLPADEVPELVVHACIELAVRAISGALAPDLSAQKKRVQVGPIEVEYLPTAREGKAFQAVEQLLAPLLMNAGSSSLKVMRA